MLEYNPLLQKAQSESPPIPVGAGIMVVVVGIVVVREPPPHASD